MLGGSSQVAFQVGVRSNQWHRNDEVTDHRVPVYWEVYICSYT